MKKYRVWWRGTNGIETIIVHANDYRIDEGYLYFYRSDVNESRYNVIFASGEWIFVEVVDEDE